MRPNQVISVPPIHGRTVCGSGEPKKGKGSHVNRQSAGSSHIDFTPDIRHGPRPGPVAEVNREISRAEFVDASKEMLSRSHKRKATPNTKCRSCRRWLHDERKGSGSLEIPRHMG